MSDSWSCPRCDLTVVRGAEELSEWKGMLRAIQADHAERKHGVAWRLVGWPRGRRTETQHGGAE